MKKASIIICVFLGCLVGHGWAAKPSVSELLDELDEMIIQKKQYHARKEDKLKYLKEAFHMASDLQKKYEICGDLFLEYLHYQTDSALYYVNEKSLILSELDSLASKDEIIVSRAEVMGIMGMYNEALFELLRLSPSTMSKETLSYYYRTFRGYYGWLADYTADTKTKQKYLEKTNLYRDSILLFTAPGIDRDIAFAEKHIYEGRPEEAFDILQKYEDKNQSIKQEAYAYYTLSEAYEATGNIDMQVYYLAKTALLDMQMAVREYASLQKLARVMYSRGDLERAYRYLNCSMEDAVACNARLRFLEVTEYYPIIDKAYKTKEAEERAVTRKMLIIVSVLAVLLIALTAYLYYWMKKLTVMRRRLYEANRKLVSANQNLAETGKIKEVYIARYLDKCVGYLEKLEQYRRSLEKLAMASKIEELFKTIRSEQFLRDERKLFYNEFDKSFLDLFPNFIEDFNALLQEEGKIYPKSGELLNTELRIFALIRLGVTDANRIAHFLGYSLATVYNYRSKIRNKAAGDKEAFEQAVMNL